MAVDVVLHTNGSAAPPAASVRRRLRAGLPAIYTDGDFGMRFLEGLEQVLDPIVATLDSLPAHFHAELAPDHALAGLAAWLGVEDVEGLPPEARREALRRAGELGRLRGTRAGLQLALRVFFPGLELRIEDNGSVGVSTEPGPAPPAPAASFSVYSDDPLGDDVQLAVARTIERWKPVHAQYRLRVKRGTGEVTPPPVAAVAEPPAAETEPDPEDPPTTGEPA